MDAREFNDAFLDAQYLKLDEGALAFVFSRERLDRLLALPENEVRALLETNRERIVDLYAETTHRILHEAFYNDLFEELAELPDELVAPFIHLALRRIEDEKVEAARVGVVRVFQEKQRRKN